MDTNKWQVQLIIPVLVEPVMTLVLHNVHVTITHIDSTEWIVFQSLIKIQMPPPHEVLAERKYGTNKPVITAKAGQGEVNTYEFS